MKQVLWLTLGVIIGLFLIPLGCRLFKKQVHQKIYLWSFASLYGASILYFSLLCRTPRAPVSFHFKPFYTYKVAFACWGGFKTVSKAICNSVLWSSQNIFEVTKNSPIEECFLNIVCFIPFGFFAGLLSKKACWWKVILAGALVSMTIELLQASFYLGSCELDDVFNNTLGTLVGWGLYKLYSRIRF